MIDKEGPSEGGAKSQEDAVQGDAAGDSGWGPHGPAKESSLWLDREAFSLLPSRAGPSL